MKNLFQETYKLTYTPQGKAKFLSLLDENFRVMEIKDGEFDKALELEALPAEATPEPLQRPTTNDNPKSGVNVPIKIKN